MTYHFYYERSEFRCWFGYWQDDDGNQICEAVNAPSKEGILLELGAQRSEALNRVNSGRRWPEFSEV